MQIRLIYNHHHHGHIYYRNLCSQNFHKWPGAAAHYDITTDESRARLAPERKDRQRLASARATSPRRRRLAQAPLLRCRTRGSESDARKESATHESAKGHRWDRDQRLPEFLTYSFKFSGYFLGCLNGSLIRTTWN
jgi:hypothetical protein